MSKSPIYLIVIHYSEIALKGNNRKFFENLLINNIRKHISHLKHSSITHYESRILVNDIAINDWKFFKNCLSNVMGLKNFTLMIKCKTDIGALKSTIVQLK